MKPGSEDTLLLAATAAALARRGWPAAKTAALLADALPPGAARDRLAAAAAALERGDLPLAAAGDPVTALLARGETAGPDALTAIAHAQALELRARRMASAALGYPLAGAAMAIIMIVVGGFVLRSIESFYLDLGAQPNGLGFIALAVLPWIEVIGWVLLVCAIGAVIAIAAGVSSLLPGVRSMRLASKLRQLDAAFAAGMPATAAFATASPGARGFDSFALSERERALVERLASRSGPGPAARALALELERDGREASRTARLLLPLIGLFVLLLLFGLTGIAILGPIFTLHP